MSDFILLAVIIANIATIWTLFTLNKRVTTLQMVAISQNILLGRVLEVTPIDGVEIVKDEDTTEIKVGV